jgi:hypothetical protein
MWNTMSPVLCLSTHHALLAPPRVTYSACIHAFTHVIRLHSHAFTHVCVHKWHHSYMCSWQDTPVVAARSVVCWCTNGKRAARTVPRNHQRTHPSHAASPYQGCFQPARIWLHRPPGLHLLLSLSPLFCFKDIYFQNVTTQDEMYAGSLWPWWRPPLGIWINSCVIIYKWRVLAAERRLKCLATSALYMHAATFTWQVCSHTCNIMLQPRMHQNVDTLLQRRYIALTLFLSLRANLSLPCSKTTPAFAALIFIADIQINIHMNHMYIHKHIHMNHDQCTYVRTGKTISMHTYAYMYTYIHTYIVMVRASNFKFYLVQLADQSSSVLSEAHVLLSQMDQCYPQVYMYEWILISIMCICMSFCLSVATESELHIMHVSTYLCMHVCMDITSNCRRLRPQLLVVSCWGIPQIMLLKQLSLSEAALFVICECRTYCMYIWPEPVLLVCTWFWVVHSKSAHGFESGCASEMAHGPESTHDEGANDYDTRTLQVAVEHSSEQAASMLLTSVKEEVARLHELGQVVVCVCMCMYMRLPGFTN